MSLLVLGQLTVWIPLRPALADTFSHAPAGAVAVGWTFSLAMAVGVLVAGPLADRHGCRPVLLGGLGALGAASLVAAAAPTWPLLLGARAAQGLAAASFSPTAVAWIAETLPTARRRRGLAIVITAMQAATPVGQLYGQAVGVVAGWPVVQASLAGCYLLAAVGLARWLTSSPGSLGARQPARTDRRLVAAGGTASLLTCWLLSGLLHGAVVAMYAGLPPHLAGVSPAAAEILALVRGGGLAAILTAPLLLALLASRPLASQALVGVGLAVAGLLSQALVGNLGVLVVASSLVAAGMPVTSAPLSDLIVRLAAGARASALAVQSTVIDLGIAAGATAAAQLGYAMVCTAAAAAVAAGGLLVARTVRAAAAAPTPAPHGGHPMAQALPGPVLHATVSADPRTTRGLV